MLKDKISKEQFIDYIDKIKEKDKLIHSIYQSSNRLIDLIEFSDKIIQPYNLLEKIFFTDIERDYIYWFLYEYNEDMMKIYDANTHEVIADIKTVNDLWEYLNRE